MFCGPHNNYCGAGAGAAYTSDADFAPQGAWQDSTGFQSVAGLNDGMVGQVPVYSTQGYNTNNDPTLQKYLDAGWTLADGDIQQPGIQQPGIQQFPRSKKGCDVKSVKESLTEFRKLIKKDDKNALVQFFDSRQVHKRDYKVQKDKFCKLAKSIIKRKTCNFIAVDVAKVPEVLESSKKDGNRKPYLAAGEAMPSNSPVYRRFDENGNSFEVQMELSDPYSLEDWVRENYDKKHFPCLRGSPKQKKKSFRSKKDRTKYYKKANL